jgi:hypothetical protein
MQASALWADIAFLFLGEHALEFLERIERRRHAGVCCSCNT